MSRKRCELGVPIFLWELLSYGVGSLALGMYVGWALATNR